MLKSITVVLFLGALCLPASAEELYDASANTEAPYCQAVLGPQETPEITAYAEVCGRAVFDYLFDAGLLIEERAVEQVECGAQLILNHPDAPNTVASILAAEFEKECGSPVTM